MRDEDTGLGGLPQWVKYGLIIVDRVGFPILAFLIMAYICFSSLQKVTMSIDNNTQHMTEAINANTNMLNMLRREITKSFDR